jgi:hypothetical protein
MKTYVYRSERNRSISDDLHDYQEPKRGGGDPTHGCILMEIIMSEWMNVKEIYMSGQMNMKEINMSGWMNA